MGMLPVETLWHLLCGSQGRQVEPKISPLDSPHQRTGVHNHWTGDVLRTAALEWRLQTLGLPVLWQSSPEPVWVLDDICNCTRERTKRLFRLCTNDSCMSQLMVPAPETGDFSLVCCIIPNLFHRSLDDLVTVYNVENC